MLSCTERWSDEEDQGSDQAHKDSAWFGVSHLRWPRVPGDRVNGGIGPRGCAQSRMQEIGPKSRKMTSH
jgi:hypothetical protein